MEKKKNKRNEVDFEDYLTDALKSHGYLFPETDEQVAAFEKNVEEADVPEELDSPDFIFETESSETEKNWAIAARVGKEIPDDVLEKMKKDKKEARKKKNGNK